MWDGNAVHWRHCASYQIPSDLWRYFELAVETRPEVLVETGYGNGGTSLFIQDAAWIHGLEIEGHGVDQDSIKLFPQVRSAVGDRRTMVICDSDVYSYEHMAKELDLYGSLVQPGQVLVVCHTDREDWGARRAALEFLDLHPEFSRLPEPSPTMNPFGYLKRIR
jgi:cephalosporin hydroxylase